MSVVLILVVAAPLLGAALLLLPGVGDRAARRIGVGATAATFVGAVVLACAFRRGRGMRFETDRSWAPSLGLRFHLGIDGISLPLLVLTTLLTLLVAVHSLWNIPPGGSSRAFVALFLLLETGTLGTFAALDLLVFFLFFEVVLVPMYFLINRWGSAGERGPASYTFILYTLLGSAVMLLGFLLIQAKTGTFDMVELADRHGAGMSHGVQVLAFLAIGLGLAVKVPMWPLHTWLPDAHTAAPTAGSVLLAGVLLKMGTYGLIRIAVPMLPQGAETFAPYLAAFGVVGIVYGSLVCLALLGDPDGDLKRIIAYSSVGHMGFALLGIATLTPQGINGALFVNIGHGLVTGLLFFLAGAVKDRHGTALLGRLGGGMYGRTPRLGALVAFGAVAGLGLPGLAGFWGELLAMYGAYRPAAGLSVGGYRTFLALAGLGTVLTAAYLLGLVRRLCMGPAGGGSTGADGAGAAVAGAEMAGAAATRVDVTGPELVVWTPLVVLTLVAGLWPATLLAITDPAVRALMGGD